MPLARIITKSADDSLELSMQLRSRGFRVETVTPDQIPSAPADLEVCLEECAPEDVLTKAALVKESEDLWVFVAPGALDERSRPMRAIPLIPQVVEFRVPELITAAVAEIKSKVEISALEVQAPSLEAKASVVEVQIPAVVVKEVVLEPEDDPIMSELEAQTPVAIAEQAPSVEEIPMLVAGPVVTAATPIVSPAEIKRTEIAPVAAEPKSQVAPAPTEVAAQVPVAVKVKPAPAAPTLSLERIKRIPVLKRAIPEIPIVPERVEPKLILCRPSPPKPKKRGPWRSYKVAFQSGPKLWGTASVTFALIVLAGLLATVVAVRPALPAKQTAPKSANPAIFLPSAQASTAVSSGHAAAPVSSTASVEKAAAAGKAGANNPDAQSQHASAPHRRSSSDDGVIAEDTVIFYDRKPATREAKAPPAAVKRYSDAN